MTVPSGCERFRLHLALDRSHDLSYGHLMTAAKKPVKEMPVTEFKAHCLHHLESVRRAGQALTLTRRGVPIARVVPMQEEPRPLRGMLANRITFHGDIVQTDVADEWEAAH